MRKNIQVLSRKKIWLSLAGILILSLFCAFLVYPNLPDSFPGQAFFAKFYPHLGLDLQGGTHLTYQADVSDIPSADQDSALEGVRDVIERRVNAFGVSEPLVQTRSGHRLIVELAGVNDVNEAIKQIGETPLLEFKELEETQKDLSQEEKDKIKSEAAQALLKAQEINQRALAGEDFAALAKEFSEDPGTKDNGGDLGYVKRGDLVSEFEQAIFDDLQVDQITPEPIKSQFGYHIIKKTGEEYDEEDLLVKSSHILIAVADESTAGLSYDWKNTQLSGKNLKASRVEFDPNTGQPNVTLEFNSEGADLFAEITKRNINKQVAIFLDNQPISVPTVQEAISGGTAVISGNFNLNEAKLLAQRLNAGALPVPIQLISQQTVGPSLGKISLQKSLLAGFIGLIIVILFMIIYYRLMGLFAVLALIIYGLISLSIFEIWPVTLTLSGIAGFILSIGMAVDANILIFERTKEELYNGKPLGMSVEEGFARAWPSIRDSNISSLITCAILFWFGSSLIKGFAITLGLGILVSMFSAITITRTFLRLTTGKFFAEHQGLFSVNKKNKNLS
ncbi:MAG TPA: protein translocase subunit SecD [Patescibacteria group bacterium]|nr:protein translocase subunit SecD [Patescibacteria group bacterium]